MNKKNHRAVGPPAPDLADDRILDTKELLQRIPLRRQTIWRMVRDGKFPRPIRLTSSRLGWRWSTVLAWIAQRESDPVDRRQYFKLASCKYRTL